jgi:hypothetical protein
MFRTATNEEIGKYLFKLIDEKSDKFKSGRDFCKQYLFLEKGEQPSDDEIQKQANRLSGIKSGKYGLQIQDLGYYTELLEITCEELLSAGKSKPAFPDRYSNYTFAHSTDRGYWERYINNDDKLFLNADEYGKTILDYAFECENYGLIKFLTENNYITIVDNESTKDYVMTFMPPDKAMKYMSRNANKLNDEIINNDKIRTTVVALAIKKNDKYFLTKLRAREIPALYSVCEYGFSTQFDNFESSYNDKLTNAVANADKEILGYFSEPFSIKSEHSEGVFIYPFLGRLLDKMISENNKNTVYVLERTLDYNSNVLNELSEKIAQSYIMYKKYCDDKEAFSGAVKYFDMNDNGVFTFMNYDPSDTSNLIKMKSNVIHISKRSKDEKVNELISKINKIYFAIKNQSKDSLLKAD